MNKPILAPLFESLNRGGTLLTPNNRLARQLLSLWSKAQKNLANPKPLCLPYNAYLTQCYQMIQVMQGANTQRYPILLNSVQQQAIWKTIISQNNMDSTPQSGLIHALQEAWRLCHLWNLDIQDPLFNQTPQTRHFKQLYNDLSLYLTRKNAITAEQILPFLIQHDSIVNSWIPKELTWVCFDEFNPQQRQLQHLLSAAAVPQAYFELPDKITPAQQYPALHQEDEYCMLIDWITQQLPLLPKDGKIAIVIPNASDDIQFSLKNKLDKAFPNTKTNWSQGQSLADYPVIAHALAWLRLGPPHLTPHQWRLLLTSPYLCSSETDFILRSELLQMSPWTQEALIPLEALPDNLKNINFFPEQASISEWGILFKTRLHQLGFPGEYSLTSPIYQCIQRLMQLFDEFQSLTFIHTTLSKQDALDTLENIAQSTSFQPLNTKGPIEILGLLEASGCLFEQVWMLGMTDQYLPQKTHFNVWIPIELQQSQAMPRTNPEQELIFSQRILNRLKNGCQQLIASFAQHQDEIHQSPCALIRTFPIYTPNKLDFNTSMSANYLQDNLDDYLDDYLEEYNDNYLIPLPDNISAKGGTSVLGYQAQCPFKAFAAFRLHASANLPIHTGLNALKKGQLLHQVFFEFWKDLKNQRNLIALTSEEKNILINTILNKVFAELNTPVFQGLCKDIERQQQERRLNHLINYEQERDPFVVESLEQAYQIILSQLELNIRIDRLDKDLNSSSKSVIDYKSHLPSPMPWHEERPEHPQLLLYALLDNQINELIFLEVKAKGVQNKSFKVDENQRQIWLERLSLLAKEFKQGHCPPQPKRAQICQNCDFSNLCKISERNGVRFT